MSKLTVDQVQSALKIPTVLLERSESMSDIERIRYVYNMAIDDAANFAMDMAKTNPQQRTTLESISAEIRNWMTIPEEQSNVR